MLRAVLIGVLCTLFAAEAAAQITTYVAPQRPVAPTRELIASADSVRRDSVAAVAVTNMKVWVDSAAGVSVPDHVGDSIPANDPGRPVTTFANGAVAPATASDLPTVAVLGVIMLLAGAALIVHRPRG